jgi:hypothetical protein
VRPDKAFLERSNVIARSAHHPSPISAGLKELQVAFNNFPDIAPEIAVIRSHSRW